MHFIDTSRHWHLYDKRISDILRTYYAITPLAARAK
jgi:hypothetical protein